ASTQRPDTSPPGAAGPPASYTATVGSEPDPMPDAVDGYAADGPLEAGTIQVLPGVVSFTDRFRATDDCDSNFWTMQWRAEGSPPVPVMATAAPAVRDEEFDAVLSDLTDSGAPAGTAGYLTGGACSDAAFAFAPGTAADVEPVDVAYELQLWEPGATSAGAPVPAPADGTTPRPATVSCEEYAPQPDGLPIPPCTEGPAIFFIQERLIELGASLTSDGTFGPATAAAVVDFQVDGDQIPDGVVGWRTWSRLFDGVDLPGDDLDGNGVVTPEEIPFD
ncbi:MAG TPA: peptidoglycan-binding domain-containing protein, partial [Ilumatobacteraceae bacterium]